jgi:hypothetical protein
MRQKFQSPDDTAPLSSAEVKERLELRTTASPSESSWPVVGRILPFTFRLTCQDSNQRHPQHRGLRTTEVVKGLPHPFVDFDGVFRHLGDRRGRGEQVSFRTEPFLGAKLRGVKCKRICVYQLYP